MDLCKKKPVHKLTPSVTYQMILTSHGACMIFKNYDNTYARKITVNIEGSQNLEFASGEAADQNTISVEPMKGVYLVMKIVEPGQKPNLTY